MGPRGALRLPSALGLLLGGVAAALVPAGTAAAASQVCMGVVVDDGDGTAPSVQAAQVAPGTSDLQALSDVGQTPTQNASGLVCAIAGYPSDGLQNCLGTSNGLYLYWSYWQGDPYTNTWTYASVGPASHTVAAGQTYVEGWRYQDPGPASAAATKPAVTPAAAFAQACPGVTPVALSSGGGSGGGGSGSGSGSGVGTGDGTSGGGGSTGTPAAPVPASTDTGGVATSAGSGGSSGTGSGSSTGGNTATPAPSGASGASAGAAATSPAAPSSAATTTSVPAGQRRTTPMKVASADTAGRGRSGGVSAVPVLVVSGLIAVMAALAWFRWRRRPVEQ